MSWGYPVTIWKETTYVEKDQNGWNMIKFHGQHGACQTLMKKHSRIYNQKSSAIAQEKHAFSKTANKVVLRPTWESYSSLNKVLRITAYEFD